DRPADQVSRIAIKGKVNITFNDGQSKMVKLGNILKAAQDSCKYCSDFLAEQADLSVGEMGIPPGKSVIMIRTQKGHDLVMNAKNAGELILEPCETLLVQNLQKWDAKKRASAKVRNFPPPQKKTLLREELETSSQTDTGKTDEWPIQIPDFEHL
ncbi:MAG: Coenzyme F420 hydrogenase/dehydrogenase, beta subunit C-terminal domain, partial [Candidatus Hodarchaeales archaeon]